MNDGYFGFDYASADASELPVQRPVYERIPKTVAQRYPRDDEIHSWWHLKTSTETDNERRFVDYILV